jgi:phage terminase large subunit GpA-like protein
VAIADGATIYGQEFFAGLMPDPILTVSAWADRHRVLSSSASSEPGMWRTIRTPYLKELMDCLSTSSPVQKVTLMKGAQVGGTEAGNNWIGYVIDHSPAPMMMVMPTVPLAKRNSRQRLDPLIRDCPRLREKVGDKRAKDSSNTILAKEFGGGVLVLTGANSATGLRSTPVRYLMLDEVDAYPMDVEGEGDPVKLCERAQRTFARSKTLIVSTPTFLGRSRIEENFKQGDQSYYHVPCPGCGEHHKLNFRESDGGLFLKWEDRDPSTVAVVCTSCGEVTGEHKKSWMLENGLWVPENPDESHRHRSFHLSALYSPIGWRSWENIVEDWIKAQNKPDKLRVFVNHDLGETWFEQGEAPEWRDLYDSRETYEIGTVPKGAVFLTAGVDVQGGRNGRFEVEIVAWGRDKESWSIDFFVIQGDPGDEESWKPITGLLARTWIREDGLEMSIRTMAVDSGYATQDVYNWVRKQPKNRAIAVKGYSKLPVLVGTAKPVDVNKRGKTIRRGVLLWLVGTNVAKTEFYGWARLKAPTDEDDSPHPAGYCHWPQYAEDAFKQLTSEQIVATVDRKGYRTYEWKLLPGRRNERLDCRVYARAAAAVAGLDRFGEDDWVRLESEMDLTKPTPKPTRKKRRSGYLNKHRE